MRTILVVDESVKLERRWRREAEWDLRRVVRVLNFEESVEMRILPFDSSFTGRW